MVRPAVQIEGLDELRREFRRLKDDGLKQGLRDANKEIAEAIVDKALPNVPVHSGALKASVRALGNVGGAVGKAGSARAVPYAPPIHWGSPRRNIRAQPFLKRAADTVERDVTDRYEAHIMRMLKAVNAR